MDRGWGRVHVGEQMGRGGLTGFADVHHVAGPLGVAFVAVTGPPPVGRFDALRGPRPIPAGLVPYLIRGGPPPCPPVPRYPFVLAPPTPAPAPPGRRLPF